MQNNPGLLFLTEGPPLDQIIGRAVDTSLPSIVSAEGRRTISHTHPDVFQAARPSFLLMYICCRGATVQLSLLSCVSGHLRNGNDVKTIGKNVKDSFKSCVSAAFARVLYLHSTQASPQNEQNIKLSLPSEAFTLKEHYIKISKQRSDALNSQVMSVASTS